MNIFSKTNKCPLAICAHDPEKQPYVCYGKRHMPKCEVDGNNHKICPLYAHSKHKDNPSKQIKHLIGLEG